MFKTLYYVYSYIKEEEWISPDFTEGKGTFKPEVVVVSYQNLYFISKVIKGISPILSIFTFLQKLVYHPE